MPKTYAEDEDFLNADFTELGSLKDEFENCTFSGCNFLNADLSNVSFVECRFEDCDLSMVKLVNTALRNVTFKGCKLVGLLFENCN